MILFFLFVCYCSTSTCLYCSFYTTWSLIPGRPLIYPRPISRVIFLSPAPASLSTQEFSDVLFLTSFTLVKPLIVSHFIWHSYQFVYVFTNMQNLTHHVIFFAARIIFGLVWFGCSAIIMQIWPASCTYVKEIQDVFIASVTVLKDYLVRLACDMIAVFVFVVCFTVYVTNRVQG